MNQIVLEVLQVQETTDLKTGDTSVSFRCIVPSINAEIVLDMSEENRDIFVAALRANREAPMQAAPEPPWTGDAPDAPETTPTSAPAAPASALSVGSGQLRRAAGALGTYQAPASSAAKPL